MRSPAIWLVGDWSELTFADAIAWLRASTECQRFDSPQLAAQHHATTRNGVVPTALIIAVSRPGRFAAKDIERLHTLLPLARLVAVTGPWCEGEQRSGRPWAGVVRIPWRSWRERLPRLLGFGVGAEALSPRTATDTERVENAAATIRSKPRLHGTAAIRTHSLVTYRYLADAVGQLGVAVTPRSENDATIDVIIFDGWENVTPVSEHAPQRRILTLHFPRPDDQVRAQRAGIHTILAQPSLLTDLAAALGE